MIVHPCGMCAQWPVMRTNGIGEEKYQLECECGIPIGGRSIEEAVEKWNRGEYLASMIWFCRMADILEGEEYENQKRA